MPKKFENITTANLKRKQHRFPYLAISAVQTCSNSSWKAQCFILCILSTNTVREISQKALTRYSFLITVISHQWDQQCFKELKHFSKKYNLLLQLFQRWRQGNNRAQIFYRMYVLDSYVLWAEKIDCVPLLYTNICNYITLWGKHMSCWCETETGKRNCSF